MNKTGHIVQIIGAVVDVEFPVDAVPNVYDALIVDARQLVLEVQQQLGDGIVRTIAMGPSEGLKRKMGNILEKCDGAVCAFHLHPFKALKAAEWLAAKGFKFPYTDILAIICDDNVELFKIAFSTDTYDMDKLIDGCQTYQATKILCFLEEEIANV